MQAGTPARARRSIVPAEQVAERLLVIRGQKVLLDFDLATLYGVDTRALNQAVRRNATRFPADFMFQLTEEEYAAIRSQSVITSRRGRQRAPLAFTEHGVAMLSSVLRSDRAVRVNIEIMRAFARLRAIVASHADLARKLDALERTTDARFRVVFEAIRRMIRAPGKPCRPIGFRIAADPRPARP